MRSPECQGGRLREEEERGGRVSQTQTQTTNQQQTRQKTVLTVLLEPLFGDQAAIGHHRDAGKEHLLLAVLDQFPEVFALLDEERLAATEVDLLGARLAQQPQPLLSPFKLKVVAGLGSMKAEPAAVVALAGEVIVDAEGHNLGLALRWSQRFSKQ